MVAHRFPPILAELTEPLDESLVLFGHARTGLYMPRYHVEPDHNPYEVEIALVDDLRDGDVAVFVHAPYRLNVASTNNRIRIPSRKLLATYAQASAAVHASSQAGRAATARRTMPSVLLSDSV